MHIQAALIPALCSLVLCAQTPQDSELIRARAELENLRSLVAQGLVPRARLDAAQQAVTDAEEDVFLKRTLYGQDVSEAEADRIVAITGRRLERREQAVRDMQQLVNEGAAPRLSLTPLREQAEWSRKEHDYAVTREKLIHEMAEMARTEAALAAKLETAPAEARKLAERYDGSGIFTPLDFEKIGRAFELKFSKSLPVSANGDTAVHRALGFDHRGRVDVALNPDQPEGAWLRKYLLAHRIPYFAFRAAVPGKATGAHIHIGPMSGRIAQGG
jgi:hypothetical protein